MTELHDIVYSSLEEKNLQMHVTKTEIMFLKDSLRLVL